MNETYLEIFAKFSIYNKINNSKSKIPINEFKNFEKALKSYVDTDDDSDGGSSASDNLTLNLSPKNIDDNLIDIIVKVYKKCKTSKQKHKLTTFIAKLINQLNKTKKVLIESINNSNISLDNHSSFQTNIYQTEDIFRKIQNYSLFFLSKSIDANYFPTKKVTIDTSKLDHLSRADLINLYSTENFYSLSSEQVLKLLQATANEYLKDNNVSSCCVESKELTFNENVITYGEYDPNDGSIAINKEFLNLFDSAKSKNDQYYPYKLLSTLIHEARHRVQFSNLGKTNISDKDLSIQKAITDTSNYTSYSSYLSSADELDARNSALEYFLELATSTNNDKLRAFYNEMKIAEMSKPKNPVPHEYKNYFSNIYDEKLLDTSCKIKSDNFINVISSSFNQEISK